MSSGMMNTVDQYVLLSLLAEEDGITQKELSDRMCSVGNTITAMVRLLERKKLIRREPCDADGRARRVHLTQAGRRIQRTLITSAKPMHVLMEGDIVEWDRASFLSVWIISGRRCLIRQIIQSIESR